MRLDRLELTRYGRFTDAALDFPAPAAGAPDLHIVYGPNEAGKSTFFSAWLDFLFGIPTRTPYDFLHKGPTMRIGARLSHAGGALDLVRLKKNSASLTDAHGAAVPETGLQALLGGLSRESYGAMFSLDDETIERGGESILASKGDLGEMLFSASAGLSGLGPQLERMRTELDDFHKPSGRKGALREARAAIAELDRRRRELDTTAAAFRRLTGEVATAEAQWRQARAQEAALDGRLRQARDRQAAAPLRAHLAALVAKRQPLAGLPPATAANLARFRALEDERIALAARLADRGPRLAGFAARRSQLAPDPALSTAREAILAAEALRPEHESALKDLPRRRIERDEEQARLRLALDRLGQSGAAAGDLVLDPSRLSLLRGLLTRHSGIGAAQERATLEVERARSRLAAAAREAGMAPVPDDATGDAVGGVVDGVAPHAAPHADRDAVLHHLLATLRARDLPNASARARDERDRARAEVEAALAGLAPWQGGAAALAAAPVPADWQLAALSARAEATRQAEADARRARDQARDTLELATAEAAARDAGAGAQSVHLAAAQTARARRENLWTEHRATLDQASAAAFEAALREDDRLSALFARSLADQDRDTEARAALHRAEAALQRDTALLQQAEGARQDHLAEVAALGASLDLGAPDLASLTQWLERRQAALRLIAALSQADAALAQVQNALAGAAGDLSQALGRDDAQAAAAEGFDLLWAEALARDAAAEHNLALRRKYRETAQDLAERQEDLARASDAARLWRAEWDQAAAGSLLAGRTVDPAATGAALDGIEALGQSLQAHAALDDRIRKMEANSAAFATAAAAVLTALSLPAATPWAEVLARLNEGDSRARQSVDVEAALAQEEKAQTGDLAASAGNGAAIEALAQAFGLPQDAGGETPLAAEVAPDAFARRTEERAAALGARLAACLEGSRLAAEIEALRRDLAEKTANAGADADSAGAPEDSAALEAEVAALAADLDLARETSQQLFAALSEARRQRDAVGGDDAVARIEAERANILNDLREKSRDHLAARFGLIALEHGLRRYRDSHRSAMLARASEAFRQLSRNRYQGLAAEPDGTNEVLMAIPTEGGAKLAAALSKGTRFQLYLALRIAGYHELAAGRAMVPFIADDIMETFDDGRAAEAFALLGAMSRHGQVIYLTHHRHLCDLALAAAPEARITDLGQI